MRLWTVHPRYLDARGLVALWREGLLARKVLRGQTRGYRHHPQLERFRAHRRPRAAIDAYLHGVLREAEARGYAFSRGKIGARSPRLTLRATRGQLAHEWRHLLGKLRARSPTLHARWRNARPEPHPLFRLVPGGVAGWERSPDRRMMAARGARRMHASPIAGDRSLWTCPACARAFASRNQRHACAALDLARHLSGAAPQLRALYARFLAELRRLGPVTVLGEKSRIAFQTRMSFAQLTPRRRHLAGHLVLAERRPGCKFHRIESLSPRNHVHHFRLDSARFLDAEFRALLAAAYAVGSQAHRRRRAPSAR